MVTPSLEYYIHIVNIGHLAISEVKLMFREDSGMMAKLSNLRRETFGLKVKDEISDGVLRDLVVTDVLKSIDNRKVSIQFLLQNQKLLLQILGYYSMF